MQIISIGRVCVTTDGSRKRGLGVGVGTQSTYIYRAPQCMSLRWNWDSPTPLAASERALPPGPKGGGGAHSPAAKGVGESQFQRLEKRLALCLLCGWELSFYVWHW
jgi:hypothetical protein